VKKEYSNQMVMKIDSKRSYCCCHGGGELPA